MKKRVVRASNIKNERVACGEFGIKMLSSVDSGIRFIWASSNKQSNKLQNEIRHCFRRFLGCCHRRSPPNRPTRPPRPHRWCWSSSCQPRRRHRSRPQLIQILVSVFRFRFGFWFELEKKVKSVQCKQKREWIMKNTKCVHFRLHNTDTKPATESQPQNKEHWLNHVQPMKPLPTPSKVNSHGPLLMAKPTQSVTPPMLTVSTQKLLICQLHHQPFKSISHQWFNNDENKKLKIKQKKIFIFHSMGFCTR